MLYKEKRYLELQNLLFAKKFIENCFLTSTNVEWNKRFVLANKNVVYQNIYIYFDCKAIKLDIKQTIIGIKSYNSREKQTRVFSSFKKLKEWLNSFPKNDIYKDWFN